MTLPETSMNCPVCDGKTSHFGTNTILGRHQAEYRRCADCGFLQVMNPTWLEEAYSSAIADVDIGVISRMIDYSQVTKLLLHLFFDPSRRCIDFGAGYGAFVRRMRDLGYDFRWFDKHCENLFAKGFEAEMTERFQLLTAFEVVEHLTDPFVQIEALTRLADNVFFSTEVLAFDAPPLDAWSYYAPETGQHIAFFTRKSLERLAERLQLHLTTDGVGLHLLSREPVSSGRFSMAMNRRARRVLDLVYGRPSLLHSDYTRGRQRAMAALSSRHPTG